MESVRARLQCLVDAKVGFDEACLLFRVLYRLESHSPGRPDYPELDWVIMDAYLSELQGRHLRLRL